MSSPPIQSTDHPVRTRAAPRKRVRRWLLRGAPLFVWLGAIAAAALIHERIGGGGGQVNGFAEEAVVNLAHLEPGTVQHVHVALYEVVRPGQMLVSMDDTQVRAELATVEEDINRLRADVIARQARLDLERTLAAADVDDLLRRAELDRDIAHIDYLAQLTSNARDRILLRGAQVEFDIVRELHAVDNAAFRELNELETQVTALTEVLQANHDVLARREEAYREADRRWAVAGQHTVAGFDEAAVMAPYRIAITVRQRELMELVARIDAHTLRAPRGGQVVDVAVQPGDRVLAGELLVRISPEATQRVLAYLPEKMIHLAQPGGRVTIERLAAGMRRPLLGGTVLDLSAAVTEAPLRYRPMPNYPVWGRGVVIVLRDPRAVLVPGEAVSIRF